MTPQEQYKIDLDRWAIDIAAWQKAEKDWALSLIPGSKPMPKPGPAPRPPVPPPVDWSKLKALLGSGTVPRKPTNPPASGMPRPI